MLKRNQGAVHVTLPSSITSLRISLAADSNNLNIVISPSPLRLKRFFFDGPILFPSLLQLLTSSQASLQVLYIPALTNYSQLGDLHFSGLQHLNVSPRSPLLVKYSTQLRSLELFTAITYFASFSTIHYPQLRELNMTSAVLTKQQWITLITNCPNLERFSLEDPQGQSLQLPPTYLTSLVSLRFTYAIAQPANNTLEALPQQCKLSLFGCSLSAYSKFSDSIMSRIETMNLRIDSTAAPDWETIFRAKHLRELVLHLYVPLPKMSTPTVLGNLESLELHLLAKHLHRNHKIAAQLRRCLAFAPNMQLLRVVISNNTLNAVRQPLRDLLVSLALSGISIHLYGFPMDQELRKRCQQAWGCIEMECPTS